MYNILDKSISFLANMSVNRIGSPETVLKKDMLNGLER